MPQSRERHAAYMAERRNLRRAQAIKVLGGKCVECGAMTDLEFHHLDPDLKVRAISYMLAYTDTKFWAEVEKCVLLCHDCHKEETLAAYPEREHGTWSKAFREKCRCSPCQEYRDQLNDRRRDRRADGLIRPARGRYRH
jgi:AraC-like DNA-binding protein